MIIVNPETRGPLGDSHLGEVSGQKHADQTQSPCGYQSGYAKTVDLKKESLQETFTLSRPLIRHRQHTHVLEYKPLKAP